MVTRYTSLRISLTLLRFKEHVQENDLAVLTEGAQDYVDYVTQLEERYLKAYGEVLTFGSGDCGQLAHGVTEDEDLMVRFPRIVYSLRYSSIGRIRKSVCYIETNEWYPSHVGDSITQSSPKRLLQSSLL